MAKLSKFVKNNLFTEVGGFILDARQAKVLYDLINQITGGGSYLMVGEIAVTNISDLNAPEFLLKEPGNYGLNITDGFEGHQNMNLNIAFNSTSTSGSIGLQDILQTIRIGEKVYTRTLVHTQMGENISLSYGEWTDSTLPSNRFVSLQEKSFVQPYTIGQLAEGGIIFYILQDGDVGYDPTKQKGLVVSPNQSELAWNNEEYVLTGANKTILGYGKPNTDKIVAAQVGTIYNYPARKCTQLNLGGHVDWYLPDMDELLKLYSNSLEAGIGDLPFGMWSSTEYDLSYAILIYNDQEYNTVEKNQQYPFRAIRSYEINLSEKVEVDDEIMVSTGVEKEIRGSGKKLKDILNILENPEKIVKSLTTVDLSSLNRVDLTSGQYSLTGGLVGSLIVTNEIEDDILIGVLQELNDGDVIKVREITTIPNITYGDWVVKSVTEENKTFWDNKQEPLPYPSVPLGYYLADDGTFKPIVLNAGSSVVNLYMKAADSDIAGYKSSSYENDTLSVVKTISTTTANEIAWGEKYLYSSQVGSSESPNGLWELHLKGFVSSSVGVSQAVFRVFRYSYTEVEIDMFIKVGTEINDTTQSDIHVEYDATNTIINPTDRIGFQVGFITNGQNRTLSYTIGDGDASHINTPFAIRHSQTRQPNEVPSVQHIDSTTEKVSLIDADSVVIWNSVTGKSEVTSYSNLKTGLANTFVVKDIGNAGSATKLQTARSINGVAFDGTQGITINAVDITPRIATSLMGIANGVATLDNDTKVPLSQIPVSLLGQVNYKGMWDASIGSPSLPATPTANGDYYIVSVAGNTPMGTVSEWKVGDWLIANGTTWGKVDNTDAVSSVNGYTGTVVLSKSDVGLSNVVNSLQWHDGNHPSTVSGYGLPAYPTTLPASDVYAWAKAATKPSYAYSEITGKPTYLSQFTNDLGNYGGWLTGITSGMVTTALGYTPLPTRIFGTAANNNAGDFYATGSTVANSSLLEGHNAAYFQVAGSYAPASGSSNYIQNQYSSPQSANMWISGVINQTIASSATPIISKAGNGVEWSIGQNAGAGSSDSTYSFYSNIYGPNNSYNSIFLLNGTTGATTFASNVTVNGNLLTNNFKGSTGGDIIIDTNTSGASSLIFRTVGGERFRLDGNGDGIFTGKIISTIATGTAPLTVNSTTMVSNLNAQYLGGSSINSILKNIGSTVGTDANNITDNGYFTSYGNSSALHYPIDGGYGTLLKYGTDYPIQLYSEYNGNRLLFRVSSSGTYSSWKELYHPGNLTNNLTTNYLPKWNGSSMVNSLISDDGEYSYFSGNRFSRLINGNIRALYTGGNGLYVTNNTNTADLLNLTETGILKIFSTTPSTSPTTGALIVNGGIGVGGNLYIDGNNGNTIRISRSGYHTYQNGIDNNGYFVYDETVGLYRTVIADSGNMSIGYSGDQGYKLAVNGGGLFSGRLIVTSTEQSDMDGTTINSGSISTYGGMSAVKDINSGANINAYGNLTAYGTVRIAGGTSTQLMARDGGYIEVSSIAGSVNQTKTTINGSTSGDIVCSMPFQTGSYKKVIIYVNFMTGNTSYTFPTPFTTEWHITTNTLGNTYSSINLSGTSMEINSATNSAGILTVEGY